MDRAWRERGLAAAKRITSGIHPRRFPHQLGAHLAALLIAAPLFAADITFDPKITQAEFAKFSRTLGQGIFATPVMPARGSGVLGFDIGVAATMLKVDTGSSYWQHAVTRGSLARGNYAAVPRLVVSKGFGAGTISGSYAKFSKSGIKIYGGSVDMPLMRGSVAIPEVALRGSYATITGVDVLKLKTYGLEAFVSKGFGPVTPYAAIGRMRTDSRGTVVKTTLSDRSTINRYTAGIRLSLFVPKLVVEATQAEQRSYAAKVSFGF
jgi:hypothetical protein